MLTRLISLCLNRKNHIQNITANLDFSATYLQQDFQTQNLEEKRPGDNSSIVQDSKLVSRIEDMKIDHVQLNRMLLPIANSERQIEVDRERTLNLVTSAELGGIGSLMICIGLSNTLGVIFGATATLLICTSDLICFMGHQGFDSRSIDSETKEELLEVAHHLSADGSDMLRDRAIEYNTVNIRTIAQAVEEKTAVLHKEINKVKIVSAINLCSDFGFFRNIIPKPLVQIIMDYADLTFDKTIDGQITRTI